MGGDLVAGDEALLAQAVAGEAPQDRAVVDVEHHLAAVRVGEPHRLARGGVQAGRAEMRAGDDDGLGRGDQALVDVGLGQGRVGTVLAVEDERERVLVADAQDHQRRQPLRVGDDPADVHPFPRALLLDEPAHMLVADPGDQGRAQAEPGGADGDVGGAAADILGEARHVLEPPADLLAIEVDRGAADRDDVERPGHGPVLTAWWA